MSRKNRSLIAVLAGTSFTIVSILSGCDQNTLGTVEVSGHAPFLSSPLLSPSSVFIDSLTPSGGTYSFRVILRVTAADADGARDIASVHAVVVGPIAGAPGADLTLKDDGALPDSNANDGIYAASMQLAITRSQAGVYRVQISAVDTKNLRSNGLDLPLNVRRRNSAPVISNLVAPDTVVLPVGGMIDVALSIAASDSDGLADVSEVYFKSLTSSTPNFKFLLKDDGGIDAPPFTGWPTSGDRVAGDGVYSIQIPLVDGQSQRRTNTFLFQAIDTFGDTSAAIIHYLTVK